MSLSWIEALVAVNEDIIACEGRFRRQCSRVVDMAADGQVTAADALLLASYMTSLTLIRAHRNVLLGDVPIPT